MLCLHYNGFDSYIFVNGLKICKFKTKDFEINAAPLGLCNVSKDVSVDNIKKTRMHGYAYGFSVDFHSSDVGDTLDIFKYLLEKHDIK